MYRIRFHGRGGQGMKTASRMLGTAFFLAGFEVQDAPLYGAERRGAPIFAYVRAGRSPIQERGIIRQPDLVVVADDTLLNVPAAGVMTGVDEHTVVLIHSAESAETVQKRLHCAGPVVILPVPETASHPISVDALCAGAAVRLIGLPEASLEPAIRAELAGLEETAVNDAVAQALRAYQRLDSRAGWVKESPTPSTIADYACPAWVDLALESARVASPDIYRSATSELAKTGLWRTLRPVIDHERCHLCWSCNALCPEGAIDMADGTPHIDYLHCKGCLICVLQCPYNAITAMPERGYADERSAS